MPFSPLRGTYPIVHSCCTINGNKVRIPLCPPYCNCEFPTTTVVNSWTGYIPDLIKCRCGEDDAGGMVDWNWHECPASDVLINGPDIAFHPTYSQGTVIVRGNKSLAANMIHFWEMRVLTVLSGTDVTFGIGTDKIDLNEFKYFFHPALGASSQSWGFCYEGRIRHDGLSKKYGEKFSQGCIVGVLLDRMRGRLEFFLNRRSMGVAYSNIPNDPNLKLYPMVSSTAAKSCIRLMNATSQIECLQLRTFEALVRQPKALCKLKQLPGLKITLLKRYWFLAPQVKYSRESKSNEYDILDEAVISSKSRLSRKHKHKDDEIVDINDLYSSAHKIAVHSQSESDDEFVSSEGFDEHFHFLF